MTTVELSKGKVLWLLKGYSLYHKEIDPLCFYGWLSYAREDLIDYKHAYQHVKTWVDEFKKGDPKAAL